WMERRCARVFPGRFLDAAGLGCFEVDRMAICPQCHTELSADAPAGALCPRCLMKRGLESNTLATEAGATESENQKSRIKNQKSDWTPPPLEALVPYFPDLDLLE